VARISLYIPDELRLRMDAVGSEVNWSDVARPALTAAVAAFEHRKGRNMSTAIERLRASKLQADQHDKDRGSKDGRDWAENKAGYRDLRDLLYRRNLYPSEEPLFSLQGAAFPIHDEFSPEEIQQYVGEHLFPDEPERQRRMVHESDEYWLAFIDGALNFFKEVREQVESD